MAMGIDCLTGQLFPVLLIAVAATAVGESSVLSGADANVGIS